MTKKERTHQLLIDTAITLFIRKRSSNVSLDEVADEAGVARRTLFYHFANKESLIMEISGPILRDGLSYLSDVSARENPGLKDVSDLCYFLWNKYGKTLNLLYTIDFEDFSSLKELHFRYQSAFLDIFDRIVDLPADLASRRREIASVIFRCFVPILIQVDSMDEPEIRFRNGIANLVKGLSLG